MFAAIVRRRAMITEEEEEVIEVLPQQLLEDLDAEGDPIDADELEEALSKCAQARMAEITGGISFTQLLLADEFDVDSPVWQADYVHVPMSVSHDLLGLTPLEP